MAIVTRTSAIVASRPWSYSLVDNVDYKQFLDSAQNLHEVELLVEEAVRSKIVSDADLAKSAIIAKRGADQVSQTIAAVGGMTAGRISNSIDRSANQVSSAIEKSTDRLTNSVEASANKLSSAVASAGQATVDAIDRASGLNLEALEVLSFGIDEVNRSVDRQTHVLELQTSIIGYGFSRTVAELGDINTTLKELLATARTPSQTWALEQYEIARNAFELKLDMDALNSLSRAISGFQNQTGYSLEPRFHYLVGTIKLGGIDREGTECVDLSGAEAAFLQAAKVAPRESKKLRSNCFAMAAQAALFQRSSERALKHAGTAISEDDSCAHAHFVCGKIHVSDGESLKGKDALEKAIRSDYKTALRALGDADIGANSTVLDQAISSVAEELKSFLSKASDELEKTLNSARQIIGESHGLSEKPDLEKVVFETAAESDAIAQALLGGRLSNLCQAQLSLERAAKSSVVIAKISNALRLQIKNKLEGDTRKASASMQNTIKETEQKFHEANESKKTDRQVMGCLFVVLGAPILSFVFLFLLAQAFGKQLQAAQFSAWRIFFGGWIAIAIIGFIIRSVNHRTSRQVEKAEVERTVSNFKKNHETKILSQSESSRKLDDAILDITKSADRLSIFRVTKRIGLNSFETAQ